MEDIEWLLRNGEAVLRTASKALEQPLCDHCLGRLFARAGFGLTNRERGASIRTMMALSYELLVEEQERKVLGIEKYLPVHHDDDGMENVVPQKNEEDDWNIAGTPSMSSFLEGEQEGDCWLCHDIFNDLDELAHLVLERSRDQEFTSFLIGCKMDPGTSERERKLWEMCDPSSAEPIKEELNREIGKIFGDLLPEKVFDRKNPEVVFLVNPLFKKVDVNIKPTFFKGRYRKLVRGIPQTRWICKNCRGKGCSRCDGKGKMYDTSVEELIGQPLMEAGEGTNFKLHGKGREDVDVLALGRGRPFIIEITSPRKRTPDRDEIVRKINELSNGKVEIDELDPAERKEVPDIKEGASRKRYRARIVINGRVEEETLKYNISLLAQSPINQRTPRRVSHRRADKVRTRMVHEISAVIEEDDKVVVDLLADGGLYIKELFNGDDGRTEPSLASLLGLEVTVETLDVTDVL